MPSCRRFYLRVFIKTIIIDTISTFSAVFRTGNMLCKQKSEGNAMQWKISYFLTHLSQSEDAFYDYMKICSCVLKRLEMEIYLRLVGSNSPHA